MAQIVIDGLIHDVPTITLGDGIVVFAATGVAVEDLEGAPQSVQALALAAVAIRHAHPDWPREKVVAAVEKIEQLDYVADPDANPRGAAASGSSPTSSGESTTALASSAATAAT